MNKLGEGNFGFVYLARPLDGYEESKHQDVQPDDSLDVEKLNFELVTSPLPEQVAVKIMSKSKIAEVS